MYILSKILLFLVSPFSVAIIMALFAIFIRRFRKRFFLTSLIILAVFSNPFLFRLVIGCWEDLPEPLPVNNPKCHNIIVLGGISSHHQPSGRVKFSQSNDRLMQAILISKQNSVKNIVISGGNASYLYNYRPESSYLKELLIIMGINKDLILIDSLSRNTYENARYSLEIFERNNLPREIVLVTSAWHMPRAKRCFEKQGFKVNPVNTDFLRPMGKLKPEDLFIPSAGTLCGWDILFKEWVGIGVYLIRGYL